MQYSNLINELGLNSHEIKYYTTSTNKFTKSEIIQKYGKTRIVYNLKSKKDKIFYMKLKEIIEREAAGLISKMKYYHSYIPQKSIVTNASVHVGAKYIMKLDLENYFESFHFLFVLKSLVKIFDYDCSLFIAKCVCVSYKKYEYDKYTYHSFLPIGIPTSPIISSISSRYIDTYIIRFLSTNNLKGINYSRYSDDLTFSTNSSYKFERLISALDYNKFKNDLKGTFTLNEKKTKILGPGSSKKVTGVIVNEKLNVSKEYYGKIRMNLIFARKDFVITKEQYRIRNVNHISYEDFSDTDYELRIRSSISYIGSVIGTDNKRYKKLVLLFNIIKEFKNRIEVHNLLEDYIALVEITNRSNGKITNGTAFLSNEHGLISNYHVFEECFFDEIFRPTNHMIRIVFTESKEFDRHGQEYILNFDGNPELYFSKDLDYISFPNFQTLITNDFNSVLHSNTALYFHSDERIYNTQNVLIIGYPNGNRATFTTYVLNSNSSNNTCTLKGYLEEGSSGAPVIYKNNVVGINTQYNKFTTPKQGEFIPIKKINEDIRKQKEKML